MLEVKNVQKSFGGNHVLRGVDLKVEKGDIIVILGPSGSGKTTLLRCLNFLERADQGTMDFDGIHTDLKTASKSTISQVRKKTAFVFQNYSLFQNKTALENVMEGLIIARKVPKKKAEAIAKKTLDKVGLSERYDYYPSQLSGGQQQRVALARMMIGEPEAILLDEPFSALDGYLKDTLQKDMEDFLKQYQGDMIMVTHSRDEAFRFCKELMLLKDGRTLTFGDTRHLFEQPGLLEVARLTGCKNNSRARKLGAYEIEALDWGLKLHTTQEVPDDITHVAIRGHWMQPADTPGQNTVPFEVQDYIETTFEHQYLVKCPNADTDAVLWWMRPKPNFQLDPRANLPKYLYLPPEHLMLLKP